MKAFLMYPDRASTWNGIFRRTSLTEQRPGAGRPAADDGRRRQVPVRLHGPAAWSAISTSLPSPRSPGSGTSSAGPSGFPGLHPVPLPPADAALPGHVPPAEEDNGHPRRQLPLRRLHPVLRHDRPGTERRIPCRGGGSAQRTGVPAQHADQRPARPGPQGRGVRPAEVAGAGLAGPHPRPEPRQRLHLLRRGAGRERDAGTVGPGRLCARADVVWYWWNPRVTRGAPATERTSPRRSCPSHWPGHSQSRRRNRSRRRRSCSRR